MNRQLIRYSPTWRIAGWASLIYATAWLLLAQVNPAGVAASAPILVWMGHVLMASREPQVAFRCTFFEAALPIGGRQLWVSKKIVSLGLIWLPVLAASAVGFAVLRDPALPLLQATAGYTVILLFGTAFGIREFHEPRWICYTSLLVGGAALVAIPQVLPDSGPWVLTACVLVSAALFILTWRRVPSSFQVVGTELAEMHSASSKTSSRSPLWWSILRPIYVGQLLMLVLAGWVWRSGGSIAMVLYLGVAPVAVTARAQWRLLAHLPVSSRTFFRATWAPYAALILVAVAVRAGRDFRTITTALSAALLLALIFAFHARDWRRLRNLPKALKWISAWWLPIALTAWPDIAAGHGDRNAPVPYFALELAGMLPTNPWLLAAALLIPLAGLYWLAEHAFCEGEYIAPARTHASDYQANFQR